MVTVTTNGSLLPAKAEALAKAGLRRITVSLDSLDDRTFRAMNDADFPVAKVLEGIDAAAAASAAAFISSLTAAGAAIVAMVKSRSRIVALPSSSESTSMVTHHGVPISSWRR